MEKYTVAHTNRNTGYRIETRSTCTQKRAHTHNTGIQIKTNIHRLKNQALKYTCTHNEAHIYTYRQINMHINTQYSQKSSIPLLKNNYSAVFMHIYSHTQTEKSLHISINTYTQQLTHMYIYTHKHTRDTHTDICHSDAHTHVHTTREWRTQIQIRITHTYTHTKQVCH